MPIRIQTEDFDVSAEMRALQAGNAKIGAMVSFIGFVRNDNEDDKLNALTLEHYPGMTEKALADIEAEAQSRWALDVTLIVHRVGKLLPLAQIVLVIVGARHRADAFAACEFIVDYLKTQAPFWKKELTESGEYWVEPRASDDAALQRWKS